MSHLDAELAKLKHRMEVDGIAFLLVQFVDIHGAAKVKFVPAGTLRAVAEPVAGFAGGAVWGMGQGPHSHDMFARPDLGTYTPLPYEPGVARFASDLYVDTRAAPILSASPAQADALRKRNDGATCSTWASSPSFSWCKKPRRLDPGLGPARSRRPGKTLLRLQGDLGRLGVSACAQ